MKKRIIVLLLVICLSIGMTIHAMGGARLSNFYPQRAYHGQFSDVPPGAWYFDSVKSAYEYDLMNGVDAVTFNPDGSLTIAETIALAASIHKIYHTGSKEFGAGSPWYQPYVDYALSNGIIEAEFANYNAAATRSDFAMMVAYALPDEALTPINRIADGAIPDVLEHYSYGYAVYKLYRAGVFTSSDGEGTFHPGRTLSRAEAATIIMRVVNANSRQTVRLNNPLTPEQIYKMASPAVFFVEVFDGDGNVLKTGSGFFISDTGIAVTNYHVIIGGDNAKITMENGDIHDVLGVYGYFWKNDLALVQIDVNGVPYLECADSSAILTGATAYTLGSPLGLSGTFSRGIISQALREIEGVEYIQLDASISSGSSGGALLDAAGRVIGVTSATAISGQNINLAMPINLINDLSRDLHVPLESILVEVEYYPDHFPTPDFGAHFGLSVFNTSTSRGSMIYSYRVRDLPGEVGDVVDEYAHLLEQNLFIFWGYYTNEGVEYKQYFNSQHYIVVGIGIETVNTQECVSIYIN
ncbi:MAG: trypsin-like peptidase domain-containing protein [Oscillospiraceae bacterium]|nr:trypsin-like peptidase domain-containing protein [Oscillospiraceae bacterium]